MPRRGIDNGAGNLIDGPPNRVAENDAVDEGKRGKRHA
jgi:hypothetical protein